MAENKKRGEVGKIGTSYSKANDRWTAYVLLGYDEKGEKVRPVCSAKTEQEALDKLQIKLAEMGALKEDEIVINSQTLAEDFVKAYLLNDRMKDVKLNVISSRTFRKYADAISHFEEHFKGRKIGDIDGGEIDKFLMKKILSLSKETVDEIRKQVQRMYSWAWDDKNIQIEYSREIEKSLRKPKTKKSEPDITGYTAEELKRYKTIFSTLLNKPINKSNPEPRIEPYAVLYPVFVMLVTTGMRKEEVVALKWKDIDFKNKNIRIERAFTKGYEYDNNLEKVSGKTVLGPTKGDPRTIALTPEAEEELIKWQAFLESSDNIIDKGEGKGNFLYKAGLGNDDYIFASKRNSSWTPDGLTQAFEDCIFQYTEGRQRTKNEPIKERIQLHKIRHSVATFMAEDGAQASDIMQQMGHKDLKTSQRYINRFSSKINERNRNTISAGFNERLNKGEKAE